MKKQNIALGLGMMVILMAVVIAGCIEEDDEEAITINGEEITLSSIFDDHTTTTVETGGETYEGVSLSLLVTESGLADPGTKQYRITASDGWNQDVTWEDMEAGILVEEETMTAFPGLPGKYRIRDVSSIEPVDADTITVNGKLFVWKQVFHIIDSPVEMMDEDNNTLEGVYLSEVVNITLLDDPETHRYDLLGEDGYNQTVTWDDMVQGILVEDEMKCFFPHLEKKFHISDIVEIEVK